MTRTIHPPSLLPLRTFPRVWVATSEEADALRLASAVVAELNSDGTARARRTTLASLEPARASGRIPAGTAVLRLVPSFRQRMDSRITEHPETVCGPFGCYQESRLAEYQVPVLSMELEVVVHDGPSAAELARFTLRAEEEGREFVDLRVRASAELARRLMAMIDPEARTLHTRLLPVPAAERALAFAAKGRLADARRELRRLIQSDGLAGLEVRSRAAIFYDLAQLLRFDPEAPRDASARARSLLQRAVRLDPRGRYDRALRDLAEDERRAMTLQAQRSAAVHNFALGRGETRGEARAPTPPAGYH